MLPRTIRGGLGAFRIYRLSQESLSTFVRKKTIPIGTDAVGYRVRCSGSVDYTLRPLE